ncbi:MAG: hypothetical protein KAS75_04530 [Planctomycetes bacterium]|nr:hypothetical protein [Planctomycetota bacterium]
MAEEKQEKKKAGIVKRIFRWLGLGVLSILLGLGIWFQAPWKVIAVLLIVLLACTALPKPYRKWFWATVAAVIITLIVWVFLPDSDIGDWKPYTFDKELAAIEAKRAIPDSENAAIIYNQLLEKSENEPDAPESYQKLDRFTPWRTKDHPEAAKWLKQNRTTIQTLMEVAEMEKCRFPISVDYMNLDEGMVRLSKIRQWAYLVTSAGNNDIGDRRIDQGIEKYITVIQMGKHQHQQPTMVDFMVGIALEALAVRQFNYLIVTANAKEKRLKVIEEALAEIKHNWSSNLSEVIDNEKLFFKKFWGLYYEINSEGKTRLNRNLSKKCVEEKELTEKQLYWAKKATRAGIILHWFFMPSTPQKAGQIIDDAYERYYAMAEPDFDWATTKSNFDWQAMTEIFSLKYRFNFHYMTKFMAGTSEGVYHRIHDIYLRLLTDKKGCQLLIGLRRYKNKTRDWPESLDEIKSFVPAETFIDPTNEGEYAYKLTDDSFTLYSKGKNGIDEDGRQEKNVGTYYNPNLIDAGCDDWQIWPKPKRKSSRNSEEENTDAE